MRNPNRILIVLEIFENNDKILSKFLGTKNSELIHNIYDNWELIEKEWIEYPDSRFGQLLSNLELVTKEIENHIWNIEEDDWLFKNNHCNIEDVKFWGINFYKNGKKRKTVKYKLLKDLKTDHINNIIKFFEDQNILDKLNKEYLEYFNKRINDGK
jgi:hypothetical protein